MQESYKVVIKILKRWKTPGMVHPFWMKKNKCRPTLFFVKVEWLSCGSVLIRRIQYIFSSRKNSVCTQFREKIGIHRLLNLFSSLFSQFWWSYLALNLTMRKFYPYRGQSYKHPWLQASSGNGSGLRLAVIFESYKHDLEIAKAVVWAF